MTRVTVWCEGPTGAAVERVYPDGLGAGIASALAGDGLDVRSVALDDPGHGLAGDVLETTDVLAWWAHHRHHEVPDELAAAVQRRVLDGMGLLVLHSGHLSRVFTRLMGTSCNL